MQPIGTSPLDGNANTFAICYFGCEQSSLPNSNTKNLFSLCDRMSYDIHANPDLCC